MLFFTFRSPSFSRIVPSTFKRIPVLLSGIETTACEGGPQVTKNGGIFREHNLKFLIARVDSAEVFLEKVWKKNIFPPGFSNLTIKSRMASLWFDHLKSWLDLGKNRCQIFLAKCFPFSDSMLCLKGHLSSIYQSQLTGEQTTKIEIFGRPCCLCDVFVTKGQWID